MVKKEYYKTGKHSYMNYGDELFAKFIFDVLKNKTSRSFMEPNEAFEIGAGMGRFSYPLPEHFEKVYLIEPSKDYSDILKEVFSGRPNVIIANQNIEEFLKLELVPKKALCFGFHILHHMNTLQRNHLFSFLKSNNSPAIFVEPNPINPLLLIQLMITKDMSIKEEINYLYLTKNNLSKELLSAGIETFEHYRICLFPPFIANHLLHTPFKSLVYKAELLNGLAGFCNSYQLFYIPFSSVC